jgi:predicted metalloprotease with PDZ domain
MRRQTLLIFASLFCSALAYAQGNMAFTVSMPQPASHTVHVTFRCDGLKGELQDFKMPVWSPGYYGVGDYSRNVSNFRVEDAAGHALPYEKTARNTWRVAAGNAPVVVLNYDVFGNTSFAANTLVAEDRAYLSPSGVFMHLASRVEQPVTVAIQMPSGWKQIATGLEPVKGRPNTFLADNFDVLYDSPILMGNQEYLQFDVKGVPHYVAMEFVPESVNRPKMLADLQKMVTAATQLIGDVPYKHYTFLMVGRGNGGIEHLNSSSDFFNGESITSEAGYLRWLSFIAHEYFHNFNVKRIRPIALGPFDYDQENLTHMLWVSEGLSVYYEDLVLVRAGLMTKEQYLGKMASAIGSFENASGRHYQSATESSMNTWNSGSGVGGDRNTTISYYNNGAMIGAMLDLRIREGSKNQKSLDDVMRGLYRKYYQEKKRGFTDAEFRAECEAAAGGDMTEVLEYAATSKEVNYAKYFALAGLKLDATSADAPGGYIGLDTHTEEIAPSEMPVGGGRGGRGAGAPAQGGTQAAAGRGPATGGGGRGRGGAPAMRLVVTDVAAGSPAQAAGLKAGDHIVSVDDTPATAPVLNDAVKPDAKIKLHISRSGAEQDIEVPVAKNSKKTYTLTALPTATPSQTAILNHWLRDRQ